MRCIVFASILLLATGVSADTPGRDDLNGWLGAAQPEQGPAAGSTLGQADLPQLAPFLPPGYREEFDIPDLVLEIQATAPYQPHPAYLEASAKFAGQATLAANGSLENYTAGRPFDPAQFAAAPPDQAGLMLAWNHVHRWQYFGYKVDGLVMAYLRSGAGTLMPGVGGGAHLDRSMMQNYHRVYLNHLAMLPENGYHVGASDYGKRFYKDYMEFLDPRDVAGTAFIIERSLDATEEDQVNSFLPTERRVRRLSAQERADSFMGSEYTLDDLEGFSGRVLDFTWNYLGERRLLVVADSKHDQLQFYGPESRLPRDRFQLRRCHVVELKPHWAGHPYGAKVLFIDAETYNPALALIFNREQKLWKVIYPAYKWPALAPGETPELTQIPVWRGSVALDRIANTSTLAFSTGGSSYVAMKDADVDRLFNTSRLTSGRK
ncbi:MAG: DUF1329 domain-containing protein [Gammaproteobacteria bacterium]|nr:DUF1329 domain-containing protein [Gammaproteobacteria bacterium]MBI5615060.1 DUF1329 domain-containing protein [Gammaproteobacteria bacterium]